MDEPTAHDLIHKLIVSNATDSDSADIWLWRNDAYTRQMAFQVNEVSREEHDKWFDSLLSDTSRCIYVGRLGDAGKIGMCRFDIDPIRNFAEVSINLNPHFRNKKISAVFLKKSIDLFSSENRINLTAKIKKENIASIKCFSRCDFIFDREDELYNYYILHKMQNDEVLNKLKIIDEIENIRAKNNVNWMDLLRLAFTEAPEETKLLIRKINTDDNKISALFAKLGE